MALKAAGRHDELSRLFPYRAGPAGRAAPADSAARPA